MSLRIAWALHKRNIGLAMAANVFVYVGTIILYMVNWFFTQRIVRAQHTKLGWSMPYRIIHRASLAMLIISLLMIVVTSIWQQFTLNTNSIRIFRAFQLAGQTYFTVFAFAPIILILMSLILPRHEIDKFGAGRLRVNITILLLAAAIVSVGQIFRCVINWLPPYPLRNAQGRPQDLPWYYSKACFYGFNFVTELFVIIMYAIVRVDLRFHVPDGAKRAGDYSRSSVNVHISEKDVRNNVLSFHSNGSKETLHSYQTSIFEDAGTLADSLQYPSSTLEIDERTGAWKVKRTSGSSISSSRDSTSSRGSTWIDRNTMVDNDIPPVPEIPSRLSWPLRSSLLHPHDSVPRMEHPNPSSKRNSPTRKYELKNHGFNEHDIGYSVQAALNKLEGKSDKSSKPRTRSPPPGYDDIEAINAAGRPLPDPKYKHFSRPNSLDNPAESPRSLKGDKKDKHVTYPMIITKDGRKVLRKRRTLSTEKLAAPAPTTVPPTVYTPTHVMSGGDGPSSMPEPTTAFTSHPPTHGLAKRRSSSLEIISLTNRINEKRMSGDNNSSSPRILDLSGVPREKSAQHSPATSRSNSPRGEGGHRDGAELHEQMLRASVGCANSPLPGERAGPGQFQPGSAAGLVSARASGVQSKIGTVSSSVYSSTTTSSDQREAGRAEEEYRRFSFEAVPEDEEQGFGEEGRGRVREV